MKSANAPSKLYIPQPFASGSGAALTPIDGSSGDTPNFEDGFPANFSAPHASGGSFITRGQMNAIGNLASANDYYRACGGINTFDPKLCAKIGGYPMDAILDYYSGGILYKVRSLVDDNTVDFTGTTDTTAYTGITNGSVDNVNWAIANPSSYSPSSDVNLIFDSGETRLIDGFSIMHSFKARKSGQISVVPNLTWTEGTTEQIAILSPTVVASPVGVGIMIREFTEEPTGNIEVPAISANTTASPLTANWNEWKLLTGTYYAVGVSSSLEGGVVQSYPYLFDYNLTEGNYYLLAIARSRYVSFEGYVHSSTTQYVHKTPYASTTMQFRMSYSQN